MPASRLTSVFSATLALLCCLSPCAAQQKQPSHRVAIVIKEKHHAAGVIDELTNDEFLQLRSSAPRILVRIRIPWDQISAARLDGQPLEVDELRRRAAELLAPPAADPLSDLITEQGAEAQEVVSPFRGSVMTATRPSLALTANGHTDDDNRVQSLQVTSAPANWDADVDIDGLVVTVRPVNRSGKLVPASGRLELTIFGRAVVQGGEIHHDDRRERFPKLGQLTRNVRRSDFGEWGATYKVEFSRSDIAFAADLDDCALVNAEFTISGRGQFLASDANALIRPDSTYRDWHELTTGTRFVPRERMPDAHGR